MVQESVEQSPRSPLRLPRYPYIQPCVLFGLQFLSRESSDRFSSKSTVPNSLSQRSATWKSLMTSKRRWSPCIHLLWLSFGSRNMEQALTPPIYPENGVRRTLGSGSSLMTDYELVPHSLDLSPLDFFLWGYLIDRVYAGKPKTTVNWNLISGRKSELSLGQFEDVMLNFAMRLKKHGTKWGSFEASAIVPNRKVKDSDILIRCL